MNDFLKTARYITAGILPVAIAFVVSGFATHDQKASIVGNTNTVLPVSFASSVIQKQTSETSPVRWMTFEEAVEKSKIEKKKIFIDVYTDWCGWCKVMDKNTFTDPKIAALLNEKYYPVKFDAEQKADVVFRGTTFKFIESGRGGYHQLAAALLNNQLSYPNFVFLNEDFQIVPLVSGYSSLPGYRKPEEFHLYLLFVAEDRFKTQNVDEFKKTYKSPYGVKDEANN
jgi:thioredoxin-related protein